MPSVPTVERPSCCAGAWRRRTGRLVRPVSPLGSMPGRGWCSPWAISGLSPRAGATGRRPSASPRGKAVARHRPIPAVASAACTSPRGTWSTPSGCWSRAWPSVVPPATGDVTTDRREPGLCLCPPGAPRRGARAAGGGHQEGIRTG